MIAKGISIALVLLIELVVILLLKSLDLEAIPGKIGSVGTAMWLCALGPGLALARACFQEEYTLHLTLWITTAFVGYFITIAILLFMLPESHITLRHLAMMFFILLVSFLNMTISCVIFAMDLKRSRAAKHPVPPQR